MEDEMMRGYLYGQYYDRPIRDFADDIAKNRALSKEYDEMVYELFVRSSRPMEKRYNPLSKGKVIMFGLICFTIIITQYIIPPMYTVLGGLIFVYVPTFLMSRFLNHFRRKAGEEHDRKVMQRISEYLEKAQGIYFHLAPEMMGKESSYVLENYIEKGNEYTPYRVVLDKVIEIQKRNIIQDEHDFYNRKNAKEKQYADAVFYNLLYEAKKNINRINNR